ncbi:MAG: GntR family transcriptional regulator [Planctomycetota bacterium]|nr:GntR family transcriptional regulator [Planctomycetota bacterium]
MAEKTRRKGRPGGSVPRYRRVVEALREDLKSGRWKPGEQLPSLRQMARRYRVGLQVVRSAVKVLIAEDRIKVTPGRGIVAKNQGYVVSATSNLAAVVLGHSLRVQWESPHLAAIQRGIERGMGEICDPLLIVHDPRRLRRTIPPDLLHLPVRFVFLLGQFHASTLRRYARIGVPVALVDQPGQRWRLSSISVDNVEAARDATSRLMAMGHRRIAFLRLVLLDIRDVDPDSKERTEGFRRAFLDAGLPSPDDAVFNAFSRDTIESPNVQAIFDADPPFTAVLAADPGLARLVAGAAAARGLEVPRDLSIAAFHGKGNAHDGWTGPAVDFEEMGRRAVVELSTGKAGPLPVNVLMRTEWNEGRTAAPPGR